MHIDVAAIIREVLSDRHAVSITGLGTLRLVHQSASFSEKGTVLKPPSMALTFSEGTGSNRSLVKRISDNYKLSKEQAQQVVKRFNKNVLTLLVNYSKANIPGVALIEKSKKDKITVTPSLAYVDAYYKDLPSVSVSPILRSSSLSESKSSSVVKASKPNPVKDLASQTKKSNSSKGSNTLSNGQSGNTKAESQIKQKIYSPPPVIQSKEKKASTQAQAESSVKPAVVDSSYNQEKLQRPLYSAQTEKRRDYLWPIILLVAFLLLMLLAVKACNSIMKINTNKLELVDEVDNTIDEIVANDSISAARLEEMRNDGSLIPTSGRCKIVTGVYARLSNVVVMKERVRNRGYEVYTEEFGPYTRVGLIYNCNEETDLEAYLQTVRRELNPRAWYLDPSLYVEYQ